MSSVGSRVSGWKSQSTEGKRRAGVRQNRKSIRDVCCEEDWILEGWEMVLSSFGEELEFLSREEGKFNSFEGELDCHSARGGLPTDILGTMSKIA